MPLEGVSGESKLTTRLVAAGCFDQAPFRLIDVGVSGGEDAYWQAFGGQLRVIGFDPLVNEIARLNAERGGPERQYVAAYVGSPEHREQLAQKSLTDPVLSKNNQSLMRSSASRAARLIRYDSPTAYQEGDSDVVWAEEYVSLDGFCADHCKDGVDFIKIDTDGHDFEVLLGAQAILRDAPVLGLQVETQFHGPHHKLANTFSNIDRLLRGLGFSMFDMSAYRYSRASLPLPFVYDIPAQTHGGQISWADVLWARDVSNPLYTQQWGSELTPIQLLKTACILDLHGLPDCAAELLVTLAEVVDPLLAKHGLSPADTLDDLTPPLGNERVSYQQYVAAFEEDPSRFFPARRAGAPNQPPRWRSWLSRLRR